MKIITISKNGVDCAVANAVTTKNNNKFYFLSHGEEGRGRWEIRIPLAVKDFPPDDKQIILTEDYKLINLGKTDKRDNSLYLIVKGDNDGKYLVLLSLSPGYRGGASYKVNGKATVIGEGYEAQGTAGRMGGSPCPIILVEGPCNLSWARTGRLYGGESDFIASFDGDKWSVESDSKCMLEEAAMNYK
jgi:hypothetical protein